MAPTSNATLVYNEIPTEAPVAGRHLKRVVDDSFDPDTVPLNGGFLVKTKALSLDPYMRGKMRDPSKKSYTPAFELNKPLTTLGVGEVYRSEHPSVQAGQIFKGGMQLAEWAVVPPAAVQFGRVVENPEGLPFSTLIGACGMPGATAWVGLYDIGQAKKGETIFVSAASGAVGQIVGQLAKRDGLKVIGSAGSDDKVEFLKELGFDIAFNYKKQSTLDVLKENEVDIFFDNVGGETLDAVLATINNKGRIIACGSISQYNVPEEKRYGLKNTMNVVTKSLRWEGFIVSNHDQTAFNDTMPKLVKSGEIKTKEHITKGIDNGEAFVDMLDGRNFGKALISLE
ncbi:MDR family NADP-dependent oxidoreductase [Rhodotorula paludigena]|uniref:MDR family NADP-dependent oxidoreductase n=1 Tax=Rhodotorula paludigena TaxID=86838 RepID=UPI0031738BE6